MRKRLDDKRAQYKHEQNDWEKTDAILNPPRHAVGLVISVLAQLLQVLGVLSCRFRYRLHRGLRTRQTARAQGETIQKPDCAGQYQQYKQNQSEIPAHRFPLKKLKQSWLWSA